MSRREYLRRRRRRAGAQRRKVIHISLTQKKKVIRMSLIVVAALALVFSGIGIYSAVRNNRLAKSDGQENGDVPASVSAAAVAVESSHTEAETMAQPKAEQPVVPARDKAVALTFDDGPSRENTGKILDVLKAHGAHATFFVLGNRARVDGDILKQELEAGCEIGSHSWDHPQLNKIEWSKVKSQVSRTDQIVKKLADGYKIKLLRPPYGAISDTMRKRMKKPMILWSLDTLDWKTRNAKKVFRKVKKEVKDGDIILMHDIHAETAEAIKQVVPWLQQQGYDILTVSELMARNEKKLSNGHAYCDGKQ